MYLKYQQAVRIKYFIFIKITIPGSNMCNQIKLITKSETAIVLYHYTN